MGCEYWCVHFHGAFVGLHGAFMVQQLRGALMVLS